MKVAYLCLGGNLGDRELAIKEAIAKIKLEAGEVSAVSKIYETEAWGVTNQNAYLNCCVELKTEFDPERLINILLKIEHDLGRERNLYHTYEPRIIDIDVLFYEQVVLEFNHLTVPHPRLHLRKFVLIPLNDIASHFSHPVFKKNVMALLNECPDTGEVKLFK